MSLFACPRVFLHGVMVPSLGLLALVVGSGSVSADIYKRVDENGVITYTNIPGGGAKVFLKIPKQRRHAAAVRPPTAAQAAGNSTRFDPIIRQAAALYQIPEALVRAVIKVESNFNPAALSPANACGLMQLIPGTAERMMVTDIYDPQQNIFGGVRYLRVLANLFSGDLELTVAAYNAGENAVIRYGGIPPYEETQNYVKRVLAFYRIYREAAATAPSATAQHRQH